MRPPQGPLYRSRMADQRDNDNWLGNTKTFGNTLVSVPNTCTNCSTGFSRNWTQFSVVWSRLSTAPQPPLSTVWLSEAGLLKFSKKIWKPPHNYWPHKSDILRTRKHQKSPRRSGTLELCIPDLKSFDIRNNYLRSRFLFCTPYCHILWRTVIPSVGLIPGLGLTDWLTWRGSKFVTQSNKHDIDRQTDRRPARYR